MYKYLISLSRPVLINTGNEEQKDYNTIYGFLAPYDDDEDAFKEEIESYVGYLAAMHSWSTTNDKEFSITEQNDWIDDNGIWHLVSGANHDKFIYEFGERSRERLNLDYEIYVLEMDFFELYCPNCGRDRSLILCKKVMDSLINIAELEEQKRRIESNAVILFNKPVFLPKNYFWEEKQGYCNVYGVKLKTPLDKNILADTYTYLGYISAVEEFYLNGHTPSGYTLILDGKVDVWEKDGKTYHTMSKEMKKEYEICLQKNNLKILGYTTIHKDMDVGFRDDLLLSSERYDSMVYDLKELDDLDVQN